VGKYLDKFFGRADHLKMPLGEVLVRRGLISDEQLEEALKIQQEKTGEHGKADYLGQIIVGLKYSTELELISAINDHYQLSISSLHGDLQSTIEDSNRTSIEKLLQTRVPIWFQLSIATTSIVLFAIITLSYIVLTRQKSELYEQTVKIGNVSLNYFANNARIPLLDDNLLRLNTLIKEATSVAGIRYAFIINRKNQIKAHTIPELIGTEFKEIENKVDINSIDDVQYFTYRDPDTGEEILSLSKPVEFKNKTLGQVHVGVSLDFIEEKIAQAKWAIIAITALVVVVGALTTVWLGIRFSKPILKLVLASREIGQGRYKQELKMRANDEFSDLAKAFNQMSQELWLKSVMQDCFGKYVGSEVLEIILANPESTWVKGHKNDVTILFTDIRGFTKFSNSNEPEVVVEALNEYFQIASSIIMQEGGYIDKFIGDAVLCVFGVPIAVDDHAARAIRTALAMQKQFSEASKNGNELLAAVGIGINSGLVVAGNIGSQVKMEYTVIGDNVNIASRLNGLAKAGEIIISTKTYAIVKDMIVAEEQEPQMIKGIAKPVVTYKVLALKEQEK
jgi:adenylate cyclase